MEFGVYTFVETRRDPKTGEPAEVDRTFAELMEEIELADQVGLDVFGIGEHHRPDFVVSVPPVFLAAAAARTQTIRLSSAVTVLSLRRSGARLSAIRHARSALGRPRRDHGRRGSFIESFPLFGYDLDDYDDLFAEKLDLLLAIRDDAAVTWHGAHRAPLTAKASIRVRCKILCPSGSPSGGTPHSVPAPARSGAAGGRHHRRRAGSFAPLAGALSRGRSARRHTPRTCQARHQLHGFLADTPSKRPRTSSGYAEAMRRWAGTRLAAARRGRNSTPAAATRAFGARARRTRRREDPGPT